MADDRDLYVETAIDNYTSTHNISITDLITSDTARQIRVDIISDINDSLSLANQLRDKSNKLRYITTLPGYAVAKILLATDDVKYMNLGVKGGEIIAKRYVKTRAGWKWAGTYEIIRERECDNAVMRAFALLNPDATAHDENSMRRYIACNAETTTINNNNKLVFFRNGVWDYTSRTLTAYDDPDFEKKYGNTIALAKLPVYHPLGAGAKLTAPYAEPVITNPDGTMWRPSDCFRDPFNMNTPEGQASSLIIWQLVQFTIRHINGSPHLYHFWIDAGGKGHNGKSTLWEIIQRLICKDYENGDEDLRASGKTVIECAIEDLEKDYVLAENITTAYAIVGQESSGSTSYIENCAMIKMLSRAQEYTYRQIRQAPFSFKFSGALVQQINKAPIFAEKTDSMFTHSVNIPFVNSFDESKPYIKDDYILREEVAEWIAYHVTVDMDCLDAYDAEALKTLEPFKREMMADSMSTMQALDDIVPGLKMNFIPTELLYDLYIRWCEKNGVTGRAVVSMKLFRDDLEQYGINNNEDVEYTTKYARTSVKDISQDHMSMRAFGYANKSGYSVYLHPDALGNGITGNSNARGRLNAAQFTDETGKAKIWTKGGLVRKVKWQNKPALTVSAELDEDGE